MTDDPPAPDVAALSAELTRLKQALAASELRERSLREDSIVHVEVLETEKLALELMVDAYKDVYDFAPAPYLALDGTGTICDINLTATALLQGVREQLLGRPLRLHIDPADRRRFLDHMLQCRRTHARVTCELRLQRSDGQRIPVLLISQRATTVTSGGVTYRTAIIDLSERRLAEDTLRRSHQRLELAIAASGVGLFEWAWPTGEAVVSERWAQILGHDLAALPPGNALFDWWRAQIDPDQLAAHVDMYTRFLDGAVATHVAEVRVRHAGGQWLWVRELVQVADRAASGRVCRVVGVMVDITLERSRLTEAHARTVQLQSLAAALFRVEETERRELATLVHDDLGQRLVAIKLRLAAFDREALRPVLTLLDDTHATIRSLAFQLSPPILRDLGLVAGLRWLAREFSGRYGLAVAVDEDGPLPPLAGDPDVALFRCIRELLFNTVKHARASHAGILVITTADERTVHFVVEDDGDGFDPVTALAPNASFGLLSVRERLGWLGGDMQVDSAPGRGTQVRLIVPRASRVGGLDDEGQSD